LATMGVAGPPPKAKNDLEFFYFYCFIVFCQGAFFFNFLIFLILIFFN